MKKICLFLCFILILGLIGCNNSPEADNSKAEAEASSREEESSQPPVEESSVPEDSASDADPVLSAYRGIIADLTQEYGEKHDGKYFVFGLVMAKLVDFDNDGVPELLCSYDHTRQQQMMRPTKSVSTATKTEQLLISTRAPAPILDPA